MKSSILTNKGVAILRRALRDNVKVSVSRVLSSTHFDAVPSELESKVPSWFDGKPGTCTGLTIDGTGVHMKLHWDADDTNQPLKSFAVYIKRSTDDRDYLLYVESNGNNAITLEYDYDVIVDVPINVPQALATPVGDTLDPEVKEAIDESASSAGTALEYNSQDKKIYLKNSNGTAISEIDATAFVKDGMLDSVTVADGYMNFVFNVDAGKSEISIPLTDFFDASQYYTKAEIDGTFLNQVSYNSATNSLDFESEDGERTVSVSLD